MSSSIGVPSIPETLKEEFSKNKVVLFVGTGLSLRSGAPTWKELLQALYADMLKDNQSQSEEQNEDYTELSKMIEASSFLDAASYMNEKLGRKKIENFIIRRLKNLKCDNSHTLISALFDKIVTTNFDTLIEDAFDQIVPTIILPQNESHIHDNESFIYKIHGCLKNPRSIVITYENYQDIEESTISTLKTLFQTYTFLFVGFSLEDFDIMESLKFLMKVFDGKGREHYALLESSKARNLRTMFLKKRFNINAIKYVTVDKKTRLEVTKFLEQFQSLKNEQYSAEIAKVWV